MTHPTENGLLASLSAASYQRQIPETEAVPLRSPAEQMSQANLPIEAIVSLLRVVSGGGENEAAMIGHEGIIGTPWFMDSRNMPNRMVNTARSPRPQARGVASERGVRQARVVVHHAFAICQHVDESVDPDDRL